MQICIFLIPEDQNKSQMPKSTRSQSYFFFLGALKDSCNTNQKFLEFRSRAELLYKPTNCYSLIQIFVSHITNYQERRQTQGGENVYYHILQINYQIAPAMSEASGEMSIHSQEGQSSVLWKTTKHNDLFGTSIHMTNQKSLITVR